MPARANQVQVQIVALNTLLTAIGLCVLKLPAVQFLSLIVGVCSFIPVVGIFLSTLPMLVVALSEAGLLKVFEVCVMVFGVHAVEAYFLYPRIYASKLKLSPLLVVIALYVTEHLVGLKGLFLAVPVTVYVRSLLFDKPSEPSQTSPPPPHPAPAAL